MRSTCGAIVRGLVFLAFTGASTFGGPVAAVPAAGSTAETSDIIPPNRRTQWRPGIPGGIPSVATVCRTIDAAKYGNATADATGAIQAALDACPEGQAVVLPAGTYRTTNVLWLRKGVVLRGAGPGATRIRRDGAREDYAGTVVRINNDSALGDGVAVTVDAARGSSTVTVADASSFKVGEIVQIDQRDDPAVVTTGDCKWFKRVDADGTARSAGQLVEVVSVSGKTVGLASPLYSDLATAFRPQVVKISPAPVRYAGVEDLYLTGGIGSMIHVAFAAYAWVKNVESDRVWGRHVALAACYRCVVRDSYIHHASHGYHPGANAYGISLNSQTSDTLVENNIVYYLNKLVTLEASGGGNVIAYNYIDDPVLGGGTDWQEVAIDGSHCSHPRMELFEGNWAPHVGAAATHGSARHLTFFRNHAPARSRTVVQTANVEAVQFDASMHEMNVLGNVLLRPGVSGAIYEGVPHTAKTYAWDSWKAPAKAYWLGGWASGDDPNNFDPKVKATILRHGNFDYATNRTVWDPGIARRDLPPSLYLTEKPSFFGSEAWPFVDPERVPKVGVLPAKRRFDALP